MYVNKELKYSPARDVKTVTEAQRKQEGSPPENARDPLGQRLSCQGTAWVKEGHSGAFLRACGAQRGLSV